MEALQQYLIKSGIDESFLKDIIPNLMNKGFRKIADFEYLECADLNGKYRHSLHYVIMCIDLDINDVIKRRLWEFVHPKMPDYASGDDLEDKIFIRYIFCSCDLFVNDIAEMQLRDIKTSLKLNEIVQFICSANKIPAEQTIELYSSHGNPLQNNEITSQGVPINYVTVSINHIYIRYYRILENR